MKIFNDMEIDLQKERILKNPPFSRWIKSGESQYKLEKLVEKLWKDVKSYLSPQAIYRILRREKTDINKYLPPEPLLKAEFLVVGIVTIGEQGGKIQVQIFVGKLGHRCTGKRCINSSTKRGSRIYQEKG